MATGEGVTAPVEGLAKIPAVRVPSDDCVVYIGREIDVETKKITNEGTPYKVHEGEYIEVFPVKSMQEFFAIAEASKQLSGDGETDNAERMTKTAAGFQSICLELSNRILGWTWTDNFHIPLEQPYKNPSVIAQVSDDELMYLMSATKGETVEARKNASIISQGTSSVPERNKRPKKSA